MRENPKSKLEGWYQAYFGDPAENRTPIARMKTWCPDH